MKRGVYFLGSDNVLDLVIAFLNSFRIHNPDISLCFIPYNDDCDGILARKDAYRFEVYNDIETLRACDGISKQFHNTTNGAYRKLAIWEGMYDEFIYIDVDTIVLKNLDFAFNYLDEYPCYTSHSDISHLRQFVWKDTIYQTAKLSPKQIEYSANTGFITSRKGFLSLSQMRERLAGALFLRPHMELFYQEQPLLNYFIVTSGQHYTSLLSIFIRTKDRRIKLELWAGAKGTKFKRGRALNGEQFFLVHWAGCWQPRAFDYTWFKYLRLLRIFNETDKPRLHFFMPYKSFWIFYRDMIWPPVSK